MSLKDLVGKPVNHDQVIAGPFRHIQAVEGKVEQTVCFTDQLRLHEIDPFPRTCQGLRGDLKGSLYRLAERHILPQDHGVRIHFLTVVGVHLHDLSPQP